MKKTAASHKRITRAKTKTTKISTLGNLPSPKDELNLGLAACGRDGDWAIDIDESISGAQKWFLQIEGRSVYLDFPIRSPRVIEKMLDFLTAQQAEKPGSSQNARMAIGKDKDEPVVLLRDDEFTDRFFFLVRTRAGLVFRFTIGGPDLISLVNALRQAKEVLDETAN